MSEILTLYFTIRIDFFRLLVFLYIFNIFFGFKMSISGIFIPYTMDCRESCESKIAAGTS